MPLHELLPHFLTGFVYLAIGFIGTHSSGTRSAFWFAQFIMFCGLSHLTQGLENIGATVYFVHVGINYTMLLISIYAAYLFLVKNDSIIIHTITKKRASNR